MLDKLTTNPLNTIAPYYTMFGPEFPLAALERARGLVLDPFCGRGTTNFVARALGLPTVGVDLNPVAVAIASAKLADARPEDVIALALELCRRYSESAPVPGGEFWALGFDHRTLQEVCAIREGLLRGDFCGDSAVVLRAIMLGALHGPRGKNLQSYFSNQMPRTYATKPAAAIRYWRARGLKPEYVSAVEVVARRAVRALKNPPPRVPGGVFMGDSRRLRLPESFGPISHVVTSPPYYGMRSYVTDQWLRDWFLGGPEEPDYAANRQMDMSCPDAYAAELAAVWDRVAAHAAPRCRMVIRIGAIPSVPCDPQSLALRSLELCSSGWEVRKVAAAGAANSGKRQADQFGCVRSRPIQEVDVYAVLGG